MQAETGSLGRNWTLFRVLSAYLMLRLLWRLIVPGGGWPLSPWHYIAMGLDLMMLIGVIGLGRQIADSMSSDDDRRTRQVLLYYGGIAAGIGLLLIRFTGDAAWWTGHLH